MSEKLSNAMIELWSEEAIRSHIRDFPIATAHDIVDRLEIELSINGGFDVSREERIRLLVVRLMSLIQKIDDCKHPVNLPEKKGVGQS